MTASHASAAAVGLAASLLLALLIVFSGLRPAAAQVATTAQDAGFTILDIDSGTQGAPQQLVPDTAAPALSGLALPAAGQTLGAQSAGSSPAAGQAGTASQGMGGQGVGGQSGQGFAGQAQLMSGFGNAEGMGVLDDSNGGFGRFMWDGTDRRVIEVLLPRLPAGVTSPTLYDLERRLLLSDSDVPPPLAGSATTNLLRARLERLAALGDLQGLASLMALVPGDRMGGLPQRLRVETLLVQGDLAGACALTRTGGDGESYGDSFWLKALIFCQIAQHEASQADLSLTILRDAPRPDDQLFLRLADVALGHGTLSAAEVNRLEPASIRPLEFALLTGLQVPLPPRLLRDASPRARLQLVFNPAANLEDRTEAAEWAVTSSRLPPERLESLYAAFPFSADEVDDALQTGYALSGVEARALYFQSARAQQVPQLAAAATELALERAQADGVYEATARLMLGQLAISPTDSSFAWFADTAGRALYALGRYEEATAWLLLARQEAAVSAQAAVAAHRLWPYSRLAGVGAVNNEAGLEGWRYTQPDPNGIEVAKRLSLLRVMFQALGESDALSWIDLAMGEEERTRALPDASLLYALDDASLSGRLGETVLLSLIVMGDKLPSEVHPLALNGVLTALMRVGLPLEARALAIEAALGSGI